MNRMAADEARVQSVDQPALRCGDGCGLTVIDEEAAMQAGWSWLPTASRWRCGPCGAALYRASTMVGQGVAKPDTLPPGSRGALPKATADSIVIPYLKG